MRFAANQIKLVSLLDFITLFRAERSKQCRSIRSEKTKPEKGTSFLVFLSSIKSDDGYQMGVGYRLILAVRFSST